MRMYSNSNYSVFLLLYSTFQQQLLPNLAQGNKAAAGATPAELRPPPTCSCVAKPFEYVRSKLATKSKCKDKATSADDDNRSSRGSVIASGREDKGNGKRQRRKKPFSGRDSKKRPTAEVGTPLHMTGSIMLPKAGRENKTTNWSTNKRLWQKMKAKLLRKRRERSKNNANLQDTQTMGEIPTLMADFGGRKDRIGRQKEADHWKGLNGQRNDRKAGPIQHGNVQGNAKMVNHPRWRTGQEEVSQRRDHQTDQQINVEMEAQQKSFGTGAEDEFEPIKEAIVGAHFDPKSTNCPDCCRPDQIEEMAKREEGPIDQQWWRRQRRRSIQLGLRHFLCAELAGEVEQDVWLPIGTGLVHSEVPVWEREFHHRTGESTQQTFGHNLHDSNFRIRVLMPGTFRSLREDAFHIDVRDFLTSLTQNHLEGFENPQKSKSTFHFTHDGRFFMKSVCATEERDFFFHFFNGGFREWGWAEYERSANFNGAFTDYYRYMMEQNAAGRDEDERDGVPSSMLPKFLLLFQYEEFSDSAQTPAKEEELFLVMEWLFPSEMPSVHYKFDLKGATLFRKQDKPEELAKPLPTLLERDFVAFAEPNMWDMDSWRFLRNVNDQRAVRKANREGSPSDEVVGGHFHDGIRLNPNVLRRLKIVLERDTEFLANHNIMDYSLLLGIHFIDQGEQINGDRIDILGHCIACGKNGSFHRPVLLFLAIIDILQPYTPSRAAETTILFVTSPALDAFIIDSYAFPTDRYDNEECALNCVVPPKDYRTRFLDYIVGGKEKMEGIVFRPLI